MSRIIISKRKVELDKEVWVLINMLCFGVNIAKGIAKGVSQEPELGRRQSNSNPRRRSCSLMRPS